MNWNIVISLVQNVAILLAFALLYDYFWLQSRKKNYLLKKIFIGLAIGAITLILMLTPGVLLPGIVFDVRSVVLSVSGLFFGEIPTIVAMICAASYRIYLGGDGMYMGIAVIFTAGLIGVLWRYFRPAWRDKKFIKELTLMGLLVHFVMLTCTMLLPEDKILSTIENIAIPLIVIYIPSTILIGWFMVTQEKNFKNKRANEKLVESERRFSELLTNVHLLSIIVDNDGNIVFCNEFFLKLTGYRYYEIAGKSWIDTFVLKENRAEIRKSIENHDVSNHYEGEILNKNGNTISVFWSNVLLKDETGTVTGIASIGQDITDKKLSEEKLLEAKRRAEESDRLKSVFLSNMSHEIRTPLNTVVGFSELLSEKNLNDKKRKEYFDIVKSSGNKLIEIINDILDISKLETKQFKINKSVCYLNEIMYNTFESFKNSAELKNKPNLTLQMDFPDFLQDFEFESDTNRIQQVLDNLITNAIKYTEKGTIEFGVTSNLINGIQSLEFYVSDTGIGIDEKMYELIFERFRQVEENAYHQYGAGIGLSICKGIVDLLEGKIWVDSKIGEGSKFYFTVPYHTDFEKKKKNIKTENISLNIMNKRVIIAEDDKNSFFYLNALLKGHNLEISHAENGEVLLKMLEQETPDLILLDMNMPVKSGYDCLAEIKKRGIKTKIIAQTAYAGYDDRERCIEFGCSDYIAKPIKRGELYSVINKVMTD
ncbi:MAG TPA: ATP-binding protein [Bacteroidales bacterium]|nr:ATP-binding protein [Bacteroidales bacterium]